MKQKKKLVFFFLAMAFIIGAAVPLVAEQNFAEALQKSIYFYDAEKCGPGVTGGRLEWRGDCHLNDEFLGGFHDAGDHVKFGLPQSYAASTLAWGVYEFKEGFVNIGEYEHIMEILRWFSDYFMSCWDGKRFVYLIGEGSEDHNYWGPPELQKDELYPRPSHSTDETPGSDQSSQAAAALAIMYLILQDEDPAYATQCLTVAKELYAHAVANRGMGYDGGFYNSSFDEDQMSWGAVWLYIATENWDYINDIISVDESGEYTGYLRKIVMNPTDDWQNIWVHSWDTVWGGVFAKLAPITDDDQHWWFFRWNLEYWANIPHEDPGDGTFLARSPEGYAFLNGWGSARYNAAAQLQCLVYRKYTGREDFADWAKGQMDYLLGDNSLNLSYEVGYGENYVQHPHHRAAHGSTINSPDVPPQHKHTLWGALVGGPDLDDYHNDDIWDYIYNEVAIDYNAAFVGALAGHVYYYGMDHKPVADFPPAEPFIEEYLMAAKLEQENLERTQVTISIDCQPVHPPRYEPGLSARYYFSISEMIAAGQTVDDIRVEIYYDEALIKDGIPAAVNGPTLWDAENHIYYLEIDWGDVALFGSREFQFGLIGELDDNYDPHWDPTNDFSREGLTEELLGVKNIPIYLNDELVYGEEPGPGPITTPIPTPIPTPPPGSVKGDVNKNGVINILDALMTAQYSVGLIVTDFDINAADVNCDGLINIVDALIIAQYSVGLETESCI